MNNKAKILDIAMNLNRVGNLAADDYEKKKKRIDIFLEETKEYIDSIDKSSLSNSFRKTFDKFLKEYFLLEKESKKKYLIYIKSHCEAPDYENETEANNKNEAVNYFLNNINYNNEYKWSRDMVEKDLLETENIKTNEEKLKWAEEMMTWGNILTHRVKII